MVFAACLRKNARKATGKAAIWILHMFLCTKSFLKKILEIIPYWSKTSPFLLLSFIQNYNALWKLFEHLSQSIDQRSCFKKSFLRLLFNWFNFNTLCKKNVFVSIVSSVILKVYKYLNLIFLKFLQRYYLIPTRSKN